MLGKLVFINRLVARDLKIEESRVASATEFFFRELGREIKECNYPYLYVKGLGTFGLKVGTLEKRIRVSLKTVRKPRADGRFEKQRLGKERELFELFRIRRLIKNQLKSNKKKRNEKRAGIIVDDSKG